MHPRLVRQTAILCTLAIGLSGCTAPSTFKFEDSEDISHYQRVATEIEYPDVNECSAEQLHTPVPMSLDSSGEPRYWNLSLEEAVHLALVNSRVLRDLGGQILRTPGTVRTIMEPAIVETDPRFGVEAALSEFDTVFSSQAIGEKNDRAINNQLLGGGTNLFNQDLFNLQSQLQKRAATGTLFTLRHHTDYDANNAPANLFGSAWNTNFETEVRQPLMQNAGLEYNRIAGPNGTIGAPNGVLIARVNTDIALADFEAGVRDLVSNVENAYWDLYFAYRDLDSKIAARNSTLESWRRIEALYITGKRGGDALREAEAREQYFRFQEEVQNALSGRLIEGTQTNNGSGGGSFRSLGGVQVAERRLRLIAGLPITDGQLIRPSQEPPLAKVIFDWNEVTNEALVRRVELRRQKWQIKRRELELIAAKNFLLPNFDAIGRYRWRGFGKDLLDPRTSSNDPFDNAYQNLTDGEFQEWQLGLEYSVPLGLRRGHAAVRNAETILARDRAVLFEQERDVILGLSNAFAEVERAWGVAQTNYDRRLAANAQLGATQSAFDAGRVQLDLVLEAQRRMTESETRYFASLVEYALAVKNMHYEKGSLLDYNEVHLAEGPWPGKAYKDAAERTGGPGSPRWPFNYIFTKTKPISQGPFPQQTLPEPIAGEGEIVLPGQPLPSNVLPAESIPPGTLPANTPHELPGPSAPRRGQPGSSSSAPSAVPSAAPGAVPDHPINVLPSSVTDSGRARVAAAVKRNTTTANQPATQDVMPVNSSAPYMPVQHAIPQGATPTASPARTQPVNTPSRPTRGTPTLAPPEPIGPSTGRSAHVVYSAPHGAAIDRPAQPASFEDSGVTEFPSVR
ncbi:MAG: TolC family protein [Planctomycetota bacterium]|nr:TolC family protein [Planctomycetota bacterium]